MFSFSSCSCPCCMAPRALLRETWHFSGCSVPWWQGCFLQGTRAFGGWGGAWPPWSCQVALCLARLPTAALSEQWTDNQEMRQRWGLEGSWHLNVTTSTWRRRVKVSFHLSVYCCLRINLFPDTWAMTWKEFRLQQILHRASVWPLGLNKGKSITLLPWRPWHSLNEERWCRGPAQGGGTGGTARHRDTLRRAVPAHSTLPVPVKGSRRTWPCQADGAAEGTESSPRVQQNYSLIYFGGNQVAAVQVTRVSFTSASTGGARSGVWLLGDQWQACKDSLRLPKTVIAVMDFNHSNDFTTKKQRMLIFSWAITALQILILLA